MLSRATLARALRLRRQSLQSLLWSRPYGTLSIWSDGGGWVLDQEARELERLARSVGLDARVNWRLSRRAPQCQHYTSQFVLAEEAPFRTRQRVSIDYFHGRPGSSPAFAELAKGLERHHPALWRLRVSHSEMEQVALQAGVEPRKLFRIPIGVRLEWFPRKDAASQAAARRRFGIPKSAVVIGSFQKDGIGWGEGLEPKLIKGPDVLVEALARLRARVPELHAFLVGPSRGYVKNRLRGLQIPFTSAMLDDYPEIGECYRALDAYLVTSRDEGGPKAVLEAMASGVPLITTRVGQARDLVRHATNAWMVEQEDVEGLVHCAVEALQDSAARDAILGAARACAEANSYDAQLPLWAEFFRGYVEGP